MEIELGSLIAGGISVVGAFTTSIAYAVSAKSQADRANEKCEAIFQQMSEIRGKHDALDNKIVDRLSAIEKSLANIQGRLAIKQDPEN